MMASIPLVWQKFFALPLVQTPDYSYTIHALIDQGEFV
jgi:hypothetical protein